MLYCYTDKDDRLVAAVERVGNGRPTAPVRWLVRWSLRESAAGRQDSLYSDRFEAVAAIKRACPDATLQAFNRRGERVR